MLEIEVNPAPAKSLPSAVAFLPAHIGRYQIEAGLGCGMMGVVYKAWDPLLGRHVALKILRLDFPMREDERDGLEQRFLREASLAASLSHPNIVVVHDVGRDPGTNTPFIALEYLEGRTLAELAAPALLEWRDALRLTARLADALHHAHENGIIHRDIKPSNVMVLPSGEPKILDFGIARASAGQLTAAGEAWGTPSYMSPEQATASNVDGRSDLFSLGSVLYELLTGTRAFAADGVAQVMARVIRTEPPRPTSAFPALPTGVDTIVARALAKDPAERYPSGRVFAEDLEDVLAGRLVRARTGLRGVAALPLRAEAWQSGPFADAGSRTLTTRIPKRRGTLSRRVSRRLRSWVPGAVLGACLAVAVMLAPATSAPVAPPVQVASAMEPAFWEVPSPFAPMAAAPAPAPTPTTLPAPAPEPAIRTPLVAAVEATVVVPEPLPEPMTEPAHVALSVEHGFKSGELKVWVDDKLVLEKALAGTQTRSLLFLKRRKGTFAEVLEVPPGERLLRLEVVGDGERRSGVVHGVFKSDETRLLEVKLGDKVDLDWKS